MVDPQVAFAEAVFLGGRQGDKRDSERLRLFAEHLEDEERVTFVLPCRNSTLLLTERRMLDLTPQLVTHGAWNVRKFSGFRVEAEIPRGTAQAVRRKPVPRGPGGKIVGGELLEITARGKTFTFVTEPYGKDLTRDDLTRFLAALQGSGLPQGHEHESATSQ